MKFLLILQIFGRLLTIEFGPVDDEPEDEDEDDEEPETVAPVVRLPLGFHMPVNTLQDDEESDDEDDE